MDRESQFAAELQDLRALCDETTPRDERERLLRSLDTHVFIEPEHEVVFQSIRALFSRGPLRPDLLRIHLNNRGFPDADTEKYFSNATEESLIKDRAGSRTQ